MDPSLFGRVLLVWILLSMTLDNGPTYKPKVWQYLHLLKESSLAPTFLLVLSLVASRKNLPPRIFWIEPKQNTQWDFVERVVWKTIDEMYERKYIKYCRMSFESFNNLVQLLTLYSRSENEILVRQQTEIRLIIAAVIYRFAHGHSPEHIQRRLQIAASTLRKYIDILCDILIDRNKLFSTCISIPSRDRLQAIIEDFKDITSLSNICSAINGTHIPLADRLNRRLTLTASDFFNRKKFHSIVL
jgi:hypothetical protein